MAKFADIKLLTQCSGYCINVGLDYLPQQYLHYVVDYGLEVSPDFQRGNVWTEQQKIRFMEYMLRGGASGLDIYTNCPTWQGVKTGTYENDWYVLVDGKQRLDAALAFLNNEFPIFGAYYREYTDNPRIIVANFRWHVNTLKTREECLQWYLDLNCGGTIHTDSELDHVRALLREKKTYTRPSPQEIQAEARLDRALIQETIAKEEARREKDRLDKEERERLNEAVRQAAKAAAVAKGAATRAANKAKKR
jgi:hypothetical protein